LERGLVVLEIIVGIAPLMGLVGTIYGLIVLFGGMGKVTAEESATFARGVSLALNSTLMGLLIAIPALAAWSYYSKKVENLAVEMESLCDEFLRKHYRTDASSQAQPRFATAKAKSKPIAVRLSPQPEASPVSATIAPEVSPGPAEARAIKSEGRRVRVEAKTEPTGIIAESEAEAPPAQ
jgi:biopolymer transport protein ExbB